MLLDRRARNATGCETLVQPSRIVRKDDIGRVRFEKGLVMARTLRLLAVRHLQRAVERIGMRPRQDRQIQA